jgi:hypothetical protein
VDMDKYYLALGKFVEMFAKVEDAVFVALVRKTGVFSPRAEALFSGTRVRDAVSFIKRLHEADSTPLPPRLAEVFGQLSAINTIRDRILHWGTWPTESGTGLQVTNRLRAHADRARHEFETSPEHLDDMRNDLEIIYAALTLYSHRVARPEYPPPGSSRGQALLQFSLAPWRHKPAPLDTQGLLTAKRTRKPTTQPPASLE